jgi:hypothetical protein
VGESGAIQATTVLLVLAVCCGAYLVYALFPAYSDNLLVKQTIQQIANDAWRLAGREELRSRVMAKLPTLGSHVVADSTGHLISAPGLLVPDRDVQIDCSDRGQDCSVAEGQVVISVEYKRVVPLPYLKDKQITVHFHPSARAALTAVIW